MTKQSTPLYRVLRVATESDYKKDTMLQSISNPEWDIRVLDNEYASGIWECRGGCQSVMFTGDARFWNVVEYTR